jgi:hypothetical protein
LESFGMVEQNDELRWLAHTYQGTAGRRGGTALEHVAHVGQDFGLQPIGLYDAPEQFHPWSVEQVRAELAAGHAVVPLVKYRLLPDHYGSTVRFDHYIVIHGVDGDRFLYHDPAYELASEGSSRWIDSAALDRAMSSASIPRQAVSFAPGQRAALQPTALPTLW